MKTCIKGHQHIAREIMLFHTCSHQKRLAAVLSLKPLAREFFLRPISSHQVWKISQAKHVIDESSASFKEVPDECHEI